MQGITGYFESIAPIAPTLNPHGVRAASWAFGSGSGAGTFSTHLGEALHAVDARQHAAVARMQEVDAGTSDDLIGAMVASQDATLSFAMLTQVRNKLVGALDDLLKMPV